MLQVVRRVARQGLGVAAAGCACLVAGGCAAREGAAPASGPGAAQGSVEAAWARRVDPFLVRDSAGTPYDFPFLGGFNAPRPQLVDLDGDGDSDLVVQEVTGQLLYFEREEGAEPRFRWRPDVLREQTVGEWYRFVDANGDGNQDLLTESPFSYIRFYRNRGTAGELRLELVADTLRDTRGAPIFSDRQNIPNAADIDCDGFLDLLVGRLVGTISRYEATARVSDGPLAFRLVTDRFGGIEIVADPIAAPPGGPGAPAPAGGGLGPFALPAWDAGAAAALTRHGANTMALSDIDQDGDLDLFWGDFFEPGLLFIENTGSCEAPDLSSPPLPFPARNPLRTSGYNAPAFGDLDEDGDLDLLVGVLGGAYNPITTGADNLFHLVQEEGTFRVESSRFLSQIDVGTESVVSLVDLDGDGDLDLLVGNRIDPGEQETAHLYRFENVGGPRTPAFAWAGRLDVPGAYHNAPAFGDLDADGDLDLVLGTWRPEVLYLENVGSAIEPRFELRDSAIVTLTRGSNATPALGDLDDDGDLDVLVGEASGQLNLYRNVGGPSSPRFELVSDDYVESLEGNRRSYPVLVDWDGDGDLDLAVGTEAGGILYFENRGDRSSPAFVPAPSPFPPTRDLPALSVPALGDLDGDGSPDLLLGGAGGGVVYFEPIR